MAKSTILTINTNKPKKSYSLKGMTEVVFKGDFENETLDEITQINATGNNLTLKINDKIITLSNATNLANVSMKIGETSYEANDVFSYILANLSDITAPQKGTTVTGSFLDDTIDLTEFRLKDKAGNDITDTTKKGLTIDGGLGNDSIIGSIYKDTIKGGDGDDTFYASIGNDTYTGGKGGDTFVFSRDNGVDTITDADNLDKIQITDVEAEDLRFTRNKNDLVIYYDNTFDDDNKIVVQKYFTKKSNQRIDEIQALDENGDLISLSIAEDVEYSIKGKGKISGTTDNDKIEGSDEADTISGLGGNDKLIGYGGNDKLTGGKGSDIFQFTTTDGVDTITDAEAADKIVITDAAKEDLHFRRVKNDLEIYYDEDFDDENRIILQNYFTKKPEQRLKTIEGDGWSLDIPTEATYSITGQGKISGSSENDNIVGSDEADTITGLAGKDEINGGLGNDKLTGGADADIFKFTSIDGVDTITDAEAVDKIVITDVSKNDLQFVRDKNNLVIYYNDEFDEDNKIIIQNHFTKSTDKRLNVIEAQDGNVYLSEQKNFIVRGKGAINGSADNDYIMGSEEADTIKANAGDDVIIAGEGDDKIYGTSGNNKIIFNEGDGIDTVYSGTGRDTLLFNDIENLDALDASVSLVKKGANLHIKYSDTDTIILNNYYKNKTNSVQMLETANGESISFEDFLSTHTVTVDTIIGTDEAETIVGTEDSELIYANDGDDTVYGNDGDDVIYGGKGNDIIDGGKGVNTLMFSEGDGNDTIVAGEGIDNIKLSSNSALKFTHDLKNNDLVISYGEKDSITLKDYFLGGHSVKTVNGETVETLIENNVNDIYDFTNGCEVETIISNGGVDTLRFTGDLTYSHNVNDNNLIINYGEDKTVVIQDYFLGTHSAQFINDTSIATLIENNVNDIYDFTNGCEVETIISNGGVDTLRFTGDLTYSHNVNDNNLIINYGENKTVIIQDYFLGNHSAQFINDTSISTLIENNINDIYDFTNGCEVGTIISNGGVDTLRFTGDLTYSHNVNDNNLIINYGENKTVIIQDYFLDNHSVQFINETPIEMAIDGKVNVFYDFTGDCESDVVIQNGEGNYTLKFLSDANLKYLHDMDNNDLVISYGEDKKVTLKDYYETDSHAVKTIQVGNEVSSIVEELEKGMTILGSREAGIFRTTDDKDYISEFSLEDWNSGNIKEIKLGAGNDEFSNYESYAEGKKIYGEDGDDIIRVTQGYDNTIIGGKGNDYLSSIGGNTIVFNNGDGHDVIGRNSDAALKFADASFSELTLERYGASILIKYNDGQDSVMIAESKAPYCSIVDKNGEENSLSNFIASYGEIPTSTETTFVGTNGNDVVEIDDNYNENIKEIHLGAGNDVFKVHETEVSNAAIYGKDGNDVIVLDFGTNNSIVGGKGNDYIDLDGMDNSGATLVFNKGDGHDVVNAALYGGTIKFADSELSDLTLEKFGSSLIIKYNSGEDSVKLKYYEDAPYKIVDKNGDEVILSDFIANYGEIPVSTETTLYGTDEDDYVRGFDNQNIKEVRLGAGNDDFRDFTSEVHNKTIHGEAGNDIIKIDYGENNTIIGGKGNDHLYAQGDTNTFVFNKGDGNDTIGKYAEGVLNFADSSLDDLTLEKYGSALRIKYNDGNDSVMVQDYEGSNLKLVDKNGEEAYLSDLIMNPDDIPYSKDRSFYGTEDDDEIPDLNNSRIREIHLGAGNDVCRNLMSEMNNTTIYGEDGNDYISTGFGENNVVIGGKGNDNLYGNGGEIFFFNNGDGHDVVFSGGNATLKFADSSLDDLTVEKYGETALKIKYNNGQDSVLVQEYEASNLMLEGKDGGAIQLQDFIQHYGEKFSFTGTDGDDYVSNLYNNNLKEVHLGAGNDDFRPSDMDYFENAVIYGEDGNDRISVAGNNSTIIGGQGNDYLSMSDGVFVFNNGDGHDIVVAWSSGTLKFADSTLADLTLEKHGENALKIKYNNGQDSVMIQEYDSSALTISDKNGVSVELFDFIMSYGEIPELNSTDITGTDKDDYIVSGDELFVEIQGSKHKFGSNVGEYIISNELNNSTINGGNGNDIVSAGGNNNLIQGGNGNDRIYAEGNNNTIIGGQGNDLIAGYENSTVIFNNGDGNDIIRSWPNGILKFNDSDLSDLTLEKYGKGLLIKYNNGQDSVMIQNYQNSIDGYVISDKNGTEKTLANFVSLYGDIPNSTDTVFNGTDEDDHIEYFQNSNIKEINLGAGNDALYSSEWDGGAFNNAVINGGDGNDELGIYEGDNNVINGGAGNDYLYSWGNNNTIIGGLGNDYISSEGNNIMVFNKGDGNDIIRDYSTGTLKFADSDLADLTLEKFGDSMYIKYNNDQDSVLVNDYRASNLTIVDKNGESISAQELFMEYPDIVELPESTETVFNGTDEDDYIGNVFNPNITEFHLGAGNDEFWNDIFDDINDTAIYGEDGNDKITVWGSNDTVIGGRGNDHIRANVGPDGVILFNNGDGNDIIGQGSDATLKFADSELSDLTLEKYGEYELLIKYNNGQDSVLIQEYQGSNLMISDKNGESVSLYNFVEEYNDGELPESIETVFHGTDTDDIIDERIGSNIKEIRLGSGDDKYVIMYDLNNTAIYGEDGNDYISVMGENDTIIGGQGNDYIQSNSQSTNFIFRNGDGNDIIGWYSGGTLKFEDSLLLEDLTLEKFGEYNLLVKYNGGKDSVLIKDYQSGMLMISDKDGNQMELNQFVDMYREIHATETTIITGTDGDDEIYSGNQNNYINAGKGNNNIYFKAGNGIDTVVPGGGEDTLIFDTDLQNIQMYDNGDYFVITGYGSQNDEVRVLKENGSVGLIVANDGNMSTSYYYSPREFFGTNDDDIEYFDNLGNKISTSTIADESFYFGKGNDTLEFGKYFGNDTIYSENNDGEMNTDTLIFKNYSLADGTLRFDYWPYYLNNNVTGEEELTGDLAIRNMYVVENDSHGVTYVNYFNDNTPNVLVKDSNNDSYYIEGYSTAQNLNWAEDESAHVVLVNTQKGQESTIVSGKKSDYVYTIGGGSLNYTYNGGNDQVESNAYVNDTYVVNSFEADTKLRIYDAGGVYDTIHINTASDNLNLVFDIGYRNGVSYERPCGASIVHRDNLTVDNLKEYFLTCYQSMLRNPAKNNINGIILDSESNVYDRRGSFAYHKIGFEQISTSDKEAINFDAWYSAVKDNVINWLEMYGIADENNYVSLSYTIANGNLSDEALNELRECYNVKASDVPDQIKHYTDGNDAVTIDDYAGQYNLGKGSDTVTVIEPKQDVRINSVAELNNNGEILNTDTLIFTNHSLKSGSLEFDYTCYQDGNNEVSTLDDLTVRLFEDVPFYGSPSEISEKRQNVTMFYENFFAENETPNLKIQDEDGIHIVEKYNETKSFNWSADLTNHITFLQSQEGTHNIVSNNKVNEIVTYGGANLNYTYGGGVDFIKTWSNSDDIYTVNSFDTNTRLSIIDKGGNDTLNIGANSSDLRLVFDVYKDGWGGIVISWVKALIHKDSFSADNMKGFFTGDSAVGGIIDLNSTSSFIDKVVTTDYANGINLQTWRSQVTQNVITWLRNSDYDSTTEVFLSENKEDVQALLACYNVSY